VNPPAQRRRNKLGEGETNEAPRNLGGEDAPFALLECFTPNPRNPRKSVRDLETLGASLVRDTQIQPVVAISLERWLERWPKDATRPGFDVDAHFVTLMGSGRVEAARMRGLNGLKYTLRDDLMDHPMPLVAAAMENIAREQLTCMDEARLCKEVEEELAAQAPEGEARKVTADQIAEVFSKSRQWVAQRLGLMRLIPEAQAMIDRREPGLSFRLARAASAIAPDEQLAFVTARMEGDPDAGDTAVSPADPVGDPEVAPVPAPRQAFSRKQVLTFVQRFRASGDARTFGSIMAEAYEPEDFLDVVIGGAETLDLTAVNAMVNMLGILSERLEKEQKAEVQLEQA